MVLDEWPWNIVHFGAWSLQPQGLVTYNSQEKGEISDVRKYQMC